MDHDAQPPKIFIGAGKIAKVVVLYAAFASLWIVVSDKATERLFHESAQTALVSTLKGWTFVAVTSVLLYRLMKRIHGGAESREDARVRLGALAWPLGLLAIAAVAITGAGIARTMAHHKEKEEARLQAIADLKTHQIEDWLGERQADVRFVQTNRLWVDLFCRWREEGDVSSGDMLRGRLKEYTENKLFQSALLIDERGEPVWGTEGGPHLIDPELRGAILRAAGEPRIIQLGPYRDTGGALRLDFIAPLTAAGDCPAPVIVLRVDPARHLYAILRTWPVPSPTGETLLFRREGHEVLYLNELRHRAGTAGNLRMQVNEERLLAAKMLRREARENYPVQGEDYRGIPVIGMIRAIHGTDWFLVAKVDREELFGPMFQDVLWISMFGLLSLFVAAGGLFLFRQRQELAASERERELQAEKLRALQLLDAIAEGSGDAIFAKDAMGRYLLFNREAARVTGSDARDVLGRDDTAIFPPEQAILIQAHDRQVMEKDHTVTFQEDLTTADGNVTFSATKGPLHDTAGKVIGMFGISRDITERKKAEDALRESLAEKVALLKEVHHRVKNNLQIVASLLSLQAGRTPSSEVVDVLQDTHNRVRSMALLHEVLYHSGNLARINFAVYAEELCANLMQSFGSAASRIKLDLRVESIGLSLDQSVPCGLIINELVSNALKHAFPDGRPGSIRLELTWVGVGLLALNVSDDGVGLPPQFDQMQARTLGLRLVSRLSRQLKGELTVGGMGEQGASFHVSFPVIENTLCGDSQ